MESRNTFKSQFERLRNKEKTLRARIAAMEYYLYEEDRESYFQQALLIEECAEQLTLAARTLPSYIGHPDAEGQVEAILKQEIPVEIGYTKEGWFSVRIPMLLPKKSKGSTDYIRSFLYPAMRDFFVEKPPVRYREAVLIYRHVYDRRRPERQMRDHDNIEVNMVSDTIAMYVLNDDAPMCCNHFYCSAASTWERTEVYVVPVQDFPQWLAQEHLIPDKGVMLREYPGSRGQKHM